MTTTFNQTRNQIIYKACRMSGVLEQGESPDQELLKTAADYLNIIVKELEVHRRKLWVVERAETRVSPSSVVTNNDQTYYALKTHTSSADTEPRTGDLWEDYWYNADVLDVAATAWALDTDYTRGGIIIAPDGAQAIETMIIREDDNDYPVDIINRFKEIQITEKWETDRSKAARFDRYNSTITLYPIPDKTFTVIYDYIKLPEDILTAGGLVDIPQTLLGYLIFELAAWVAEEYSQSSEKIMRLRSTAQGKLALGIRNQDEFETKDCIDPLFKE